MPTIKPVAVISSTAEDLPDHRKQIADACHRCTCDYRWMEALPASHDDAIKASIKLVEQADVYIGVFAHRYGYIPPGSDISITEIEYEQALKKGLPCLMFFIHNEHPITDFAKMVETGPSADKLKALKKRIGEKHVVAYFKSPEDLRAHVLHALPETLKSLQSPEAAAAIPSLHFVHPIPKPPEPYIAHYYALLQTGKIIGRRKELDILTQWITKSPSPMFNVIAIGGMGKSALTWHWFHHIAPQEWPKMKGRIWWSFYESDGHFENFVTRTLAYVSSQSEAEVRKQNLRDRMDALIQILHREPCLIVLDGLERLLTAYARMDTPYLRDDDLDEKTLNAVMDAQGIRQGYDKAAVGRNTLRLAADSNVGRFLKILCQLRESRVLTSSRLFPADLQLPSGQAIGGCDYFFLQGLSETDALELWREYGLKWAPEMLPILRGLRGHALAFKLFASTVGKQGMPEDLSAWYNSIFSFRSQGWQLQVRTRVLRNALSHLSIAEKQTLNLLATFPLPVDIITLQALLVEESAFFLAHSKVSDGWPKAPFKTIAELDAGLTALEDRGLLGWDRTANRYDLHPVVRAMVQELHKEDTKEIREMIVSFFKNRPAVDWADITRHEEIFPYVEMHKALTSMQREPDAEEVLQRQVEKLIQASKPKGGVE